MPASPDAQAVLRFWFGEADDDAEVARSRNDLWWNATPEADHTVAERFGALHRDAAAGTLDPWAATPRGRLALIVVLDQFSRHLFRDRPQAFAHDPAARRLCLDGLAGGADQALRAIERVFFYMPLMHSEAIADQARSVQLNEALIESAPDSCRPILRSYAAYARGHRDLVERFGRFPHRNAILGRPATDEEAAYLAGEGAL
ncbi:MAG: DUF924 domain-containing protein [Nevskia sp.]|nr:DUF924 domain-containing protein [Nevskia sp.]